MNTLAATRCVLEPLGVEHASVMFDVLSDPAIYEFENDPPVSVEALRKRYLRLQSRGSDDGREVWLNWVLRMPAGHLAGYVQATVLPDGSSYIAYELNSRYWRCGIGSNAVSAMLIELRQHYAVSLAIAVLKARNFRSEGLLLKLGFKRAAAAQELHYRDTDDEIVFTKCLASEARAVVYPTPVGSGTPSRLPPHPDR